MKFQSIKIVFAFFACCLYGTPAVAEGESELLLFASADFLKRHSVSDMDVQSSNFTPTLDILFTYNNGPWRILGEYFASDKEAELERLQFGYEYSADTTLWLGRFHQPISVWNHRYHHGAYLQPSISRPSVENWEDDNGILPAHITGFMFDGWHSTGKTSGIRFSTAIGLAPIFEDLELRPFDVLDPDDGGSRPAGSINIAYFPDYVGESNFGLIGGYVEIEVPPDVRIGNTSTIELRQKLIGAQANWDTTKWSLIGAAYYVDNKSHGSNVEVGGHFISGYFQGTYDISKNVDLYGRFERTRNESTSYLQLFPLYVFQRELVGLRWDFAERQALHFELSSNRVVGDKYSEYRLQWSTAFP